MAAWTLVTVTVTVTVALVPVPVPVPVAIAIAIAIACIRDASGAAIVEQRRAELARGSESDDGKE